MPMLAQIEADVDSGDEEVTTGLEGRTLQESTGAGREVAGDACDHIVRLAGELGSRGGSSDQRGRRHEVGDESPKRHTLRRAML